MAVDFTRQARCLIACLVLPAVALDCFISVNSLVLYILILKYIYTRII